MKCYRNQGRDNHKIVQLMLEGIENAAEAITCDDTKGLEVMNGLKAMKLACEAFAKASQMLLQEFLSPELVAWMFKKMCESESE